MGRSPSDRNTAGTDGGAGLRAERAGAILAVVLVIVQAAATLQSRPLWLDEAYTLAAVSFPGQSLTRTHGTMGLYYALLWAWGQVSIAAWWLRLPSVLCALGSLALLRPVARHVGGRQLASVALPVLALSQMFVWKATEARAYSLETLLACACWWATVRALGGRRLDPDPRWWTLLVPLGVAGTFCHGLFVLQLVPVVALCAIGAHPRRDVLRALPALVITGAVALALRAAGASEVGTNLPGGPSAWTNSTLSELLSRHSPQKILLAEALLLGVVVGVRHARRSWQDTDRRAAALLPLAWGLLPAVALGATSIAVPLFNPRYLAASTPGLALVLGVALLALVRGTRHREVAVERAACAVGGVLVVGAVVAAGVLAPPYMAEDWRGAADAVATGAEPGDGIIFSTLPQGESVRPPFEAAWGEADATLTPEVLGAARPLGRVRRYDPIPTAENLSAAREGRGRIWLVVARGNGNGTGDAEEIASTALGDLDEQGRWVGDGGIEVRLYGPG